MRRSHSRAIRYERLDWPSITCDEFVDIYLNLYKHTWNSATSYEWQSCRSERIARQWEPTWSIKTVFRFMIGDLYFACSHRSYVNKIMSHFDISYLACKEGGGETFINGWNWVISRFIADVIVISPSWTTYKPQARLAHHTPFVLETTLENSWKITPSLIDDVGLLAATQWLLPILNFYA